MSDAEKEVGKIDETIKNDIPKMTDPGWNDYVLSLLEPSEKFEGNPKVDGLRRIARLLLGEIVSTTSDICRCPSGDFNGATVKVTVSIRPIGKPSSLWDTHLVTASGVADVNPNNTDELFANHPSATAETIAEGRALRRLLNVRSNVAEELANKKAADVSMPVSFGDSSSNNITESQVGFIDLMAQRLNIDVKKLVDKSISKRYNKIAEMTFIDAQLVLKSLSDLQQNATKISNDVVGYDANWKTYF